MTIIKEIASYQTRQVYHCRFLEMWGFSITIDLQVRENKTGSGILCDNSDLFPAFDPWCMNSIQYILIKSLVCIYPNVSTLWLGGESLTFIQVKGSDTLI